MKYTICGFSQQKLLDLGLNHTDAEILRWFIDFYATEKMVKVSVSGKEFVWVKYGKIIEDLPCLGINSTKQIARIFEKFCQKGIMAKTVVKNKKGTFACFRLIGAVVNDLQAKPEKPRQNYTVQAKPDDLDGLLTEYLTPNVQFDERAQGTLLFENPPDKNVRCSDNPPDKNVLCTDDPPDKNVLCTDNPPDKNVRCSEESVEYKDPGEQILLSNQSIINLTSIMTSLDTQYRQITETVGQVKGLVQSLLRDSSKIDNPPDKNVLCTENPPDKNVQPHRTKMSGQKTPLPNIHSAAAAADAIYAISTGQKCPVLDDPPDKNVRCIEDPPDKNVRCSENPPDKMSSALVKTAFEAEDKALVFDGAFYAAAAQSMTDNGLPLGYVKWFVAYAKRKKPDDIRNYIFKIFAARDLQETYRAEYAAKKAQQPPPPYPMYCLCGAEFKGGRKCPVCRSFYEAVDNKWVFVKYE